MSLLGSPHRIYKPGPLAVVAVVLATVAAPAGLAGLAYLLSPVAAIVLAVMLLPAAWIFIRRFALECIEVGPECLVVVRGGRHHSIPYSTIVRSVVEVDPEYGIRGFYIQRVGAPPAELTFWWLTRGILSELASVSALRVEFRKGNEPVESEFVSGP